MSADNKWKLLYSELLIFSNELYNYVAARRYWFSDYPEPILVTEGSNFSEEVGKAVLVAWHNHRTIFKTMIKDDFPRYIGTPENLEQYIVNRSKDLTNSCTFENIFIIEEFSFTRELLLMTALLIEIYIFCYDFCIYGFLPFFTDLWCKLFYKLFFARFHCEYDWNRLREECIKLSEIYDLEQVESYLHEKKSIKIKAQYFADNEMVAELLSDRYHIKPATKFYHVVKGENNRMVLDEDVEPISKYDSLMEITEKIGDPHEMACEIHEAPKILGYVGTKLESFLMTEENKPKKEEKEQRMTKNIKRMKKKKK